MAGAHFWRALLHAHRNCEPYCCNERMALYREQCSGRGSLLCAIDSRL